jgi:hypothetical protein
MCEFEPTPADAYCILARLVLAQAMNSVSVVAGRILAGDEDEEDCATIPTGAKTVGMKIG